MNNKFKVGDIVYIPNKETLISVHDKYWPTDRNRENYISEASTIVGRKLTVKETYECHSEGYVKVTDLIFEEIPYFKYRLISAMFTLYKEEINNNIPDMFGDNIYG